MRRIRRIPFIGWLIRKLERWIDKIFEVRTKDSKPYDCWTRPLILILTPCTLLSLRLMIKRIFGFLAPDLPSFDIGIGFLDGIEERIEKIIATMTTGIFDFERMLSLGENFDERLSSIGDALVQKVPLLDSIAQFDFLQCDESPCFPSLHAPGLNVSFLNDTFLPGVALNGVDYYMPDDLVSQVLDVTNRLQDIQLAVEQLLSDGVVCGSYKMMEIDVFGDMALILGLDSSELGLPSCPIEVETCADIQFSGIEAFSSRQVSPL